MIEINSLVSFILGYRRQLPSGVKVHHRKKFFFNIKG
tara:strand:+ start:1897 stop:2007 length:111 start_codon:yes stop_codon:yes gene_type:complete